MNRFNRILCLSLISIFTGSLSTSCSWNRKKEDRYTSDGKLIIDFRNMYFEDYKMDEPDKLIDVLEEKFKFKAELESYSWNDWSTQVNAKINADDCEDVFHADIKPDNFAAKVGVWQEDNMLKQLPDELIDFTTEDDASRWPNLKKLIRNTSNINDMLIKDKDGVPHLYCFPVSKNPANQERDFANWTYVYRRDIAEEQGWISPDDDDEFTWDEFVALLDHFAQYYDGQPGKSALGDVEWGFPSIQKFFVDAQKYYHYNSEKDEFECTYYLDKFKEAMDTVRKWTGVTDKDPKHQYYRLAQYELPDGRVNQLYYTNFVGVFYENLDFNNLFKLRKHFIEGNKDANKAVRFMFIRDPFENKVAISKDYNWYSMVFFDYKITENKMNKVLDIMNYMLTQEGRDLAVLGKKGEDWYEDASGKHAYEKSSEHPNSIWVKNESTGLFNKPNNGARCMRYLATLGNDGYVDDPTIDHDTFVAFDTYSSKVEKYIEDNDCRLIVDDHRAAWLKTDTLLDYGGELQQDASAAIKNYSYGIAGINDFEKFKKEVNIHGQLENIFKDINENFKK